MIYIITMIVSVLLAIPAVYAIKKKNKYGKMWIILSFVVSLLPMGLRYGIGTDYFYTYYPYFFGIGQGAISEVGYNILNRVIYILTKDYRVLFFVTSFIFLYFIYKGIRENSSNIVFSILLIYIGQSYFYSMNIVRQSIAIAIVFFSFKYLKEGKKIKYIIGCILASTFHFSAILMILLVFINKINIGNKQKIFIALGVFLFRFVIAGLFQRILQNTQYAWYLGSKYDTGEISTILIINNLIIFLLDMYSRRKNNEDKEYIMLSNINFVGFCLLLIAKSIPLVNRLIRYFTIFQILLIPKMIGRAKNKEKPLLGFVLILIMTMSMVIQIFINGGEGVYPYQSIFKK